MANGDRMLRFDIEDGPLRESVIEAAQVHGLPIMYVTKTSFLVTVRDPMDAYRFGQETQLRIQAKR